MEKITEDKKETAVILQSHGLKRTPLRTGILAILKSHDFALSAKDIKDKLGGNPDRVTLYRALHSFEENGIIHQVPDEKSGIKYALCADDCPRSAHKATHAHFICQVCHQTYCLENVKVPAVELSEGFSAREFSYSIEGICKECNKKRG